MTRKVAILICLLVLTTGIVSAVCNRILPIFSKKYICHDCNVIFVGLDAMQAAHMHFLGYSKTTTPELDKVAAQGISFSQAISAASWTVPSFMSVLTSTYPSQHKMVNRYVEFSADKQVLSNIGNLSPNIISVAQTFKTLGYHTGGFTGDAGVGAVLGYNKGFDAYTDDVRFGGLYHSMMRALNWLDSDVKNDKFFMFYHGYDAHGQFDVGKDFHSAFGPPSYSGQFKGTPEEQGKLREEGLLNGRVALDPPDIDFWRSWYDGKILNADNNFGKFVKELDKRGLMSKTILVIFSDHGTEFMEHNRFDHGHTLYDELIHVPFVIVAPGLPAGKTITAQVSTLDILPTVFDLLGMSVPEDLRRQIVGKSVLPLLFNPFAGGRNVFSETDYRDYTHKRSIRTTDGWKYILSLDTMQEELYNLNADPSESNNLINIVAGKADALRNELNSHLRNDLFTDPAVRISTGCLPAYPDQCKN